MSNQDFWFFYVSEHMKKSTRIWHATGTVCVLLLLLILISTQNWWYLLLLPVIGYGPAWVSHFFIEKNKPATFRFPVRSLLSDFRMFWYTVTGQMDREVERAKHWLATNGK